jgi:hypothetical protein
MSKSKHINKRSNSKSKPILYLILQIIGIYELFVLLNGNLNITLWSIMEQITAFILTTFFITRTYKILHRTDDMNNKWYDSIEIQKFVNR